MSMEGKLLNLNGGADRDRTDDLLNAIQALSQLSYSPEKLLKTPLLSLKKSNIFYKPYMK